MKTVSVYWSRRDFRLTDNPALSHAVDEAKKPGNHFCPIFILEDYMCAGEPEHQFGYPQRLFLSKALPEYGKNFKNFSIVRGLAADSIVRLCAALRNQDTNVRVFVNEDVFPDFYAQVKKIKAHGIDLRVLPDQMTVDPETKTEAGKYYSVFTPFKNSVWKSFMEVPVLPKVALEGLSCVEASKISAVLRTIPVSESAVLKEFSTERTFVVNGSKKHVVDITELASRPLEFCGWYATEREAQSKFHTYVSEGLRDYADRRDSLPSDGTAKGTSRMSLALTWGLVSARYLRAVIQKEFEEDFITIAPKAVPIHLRAPAAYLSELLWREFYKYLLFRDPSLLRREFQERFRDKITWVNDDEALRRFEAWIRGKTGYPLVDAAMMQLQAMGWMHNRSRMVVASVLTKNLGVDWRWGQEYFRAQLFDLDEASNNGGWQWGASVGADPKPIRIFNPYLQAKNYDPDGTYQKKWLSEDAKNTTPIVEHSIARREALVRYGLGHAKIGFRRGTQFPF